MIAGTIFGAAKHTYLFPKRPNHSETVPLAKFMSFDFVIKKICSGHVLNENLFVILFNERELSAVHFFFGERFERSCLNLLPVPDMSLSGAKCVSILPSLHAFL